MERGNRRNSILKPSWGQQTMYDEDMELTETVTVSRRKSLKRVSFAGKNEVKEFQTNDFDTVRNKLEDVSAASMMLDSTYMLSDTQNDKENFNSHAGLSFASMASSDVRVNSQQISHQAFQYDDMELTETVTRESAIHLHLHQTAAEVEMDITCMTESPVAEVAKPPEAHLQITEAIKQEDRCEIEMSVDCSGECVDPEIISSKIEIKTFDSVEEMRKEFKDEIVKLEHKPAAVPVTDFSECWANKSNWQVKRNEGDLVLSKYDQCLNIRLSLTNEYIAHNIRHYEVGDVEIDTKKGLTNKWAVLGLTILENTLESIGCKTTENLDKFLESVKVQTDQFAEFIAYDADRFELMCNPRTLKVNTEDLVMSFELCNIENIVLIRVTLRLAAVFPLKVEDVAIENLMGQIAHAELTNMICNIRPNGRYLTRVASCIEDFLKCLSMKSVCTMAR